MEQIIYLIVNVHGLVAAASIYDFQCLNHGSCKSGEQFAEGICIPCETGYMDTDGHSCPSCKVCTQPKSDEVALSPCNRTHDTELMCQQQGYFLARRTTIHGRHCQRCTSCNRDEIEVSPCGRYQDRSCRPQPITENKNISFPVVPNNGTETSNIGGLKKEMFVMICATIPVVLIVLAVIGCCWYRRLKKKKGDPVPAHEMEHINPNIL